MSIIANKVNSPFYPENVEDSEVGLKSELFDRRLRLNIAEFHMEYEDIQKAALSFTTIGAPIRAISNAAEATIKGVEGEIVAVPTDGLRFNATVSYIDAGYDKFIDDSVDSSYEPFETSEWTCSLGAQYTAPLSLGEITARADWYWQDDVVFSARNAFLRSNEKIHAQKSYRLLAAYIEGPCLTMG